MIDACTHTQVKLTPEILESIASIPLVAAAKKLGISKTALKNACRNLGLKRWPFRRRREDARRNAVCGCLCVGVCAIYACALSHSFLHIHMPRCMRVVDTCMPSRATQGCLRTTSLTHTHTETNAGAQSGGVHAFDPVKDELQDRLIVGSLRKRQVFAAARNGVGSRGRRFGCVRACACVSVCVGACVCVCVRVCLRPRPCIHPSIHPSIHLSIQKAYKQTYPDSDNDDDIDKAGARAGGSSSASSARTGLDGGSRSAWQMGAGAWGEKQKSHTLLAEATSLLAAGKGSLSGSIRARDGVHKSQMLGEKGIGMLPGIEMPRMTGSASPSPPIQDRQTLSHTGSQDEDDLFNVGERARQRGEVGY